jgi:glycosyltransferase involved in cell wall biosynthesis
MPDFLIVARSNNYGLTRDSRLLRQALQAAGKTCELALHRERGLLQRLLRTPRARTIIHVERVHPRWLGAGERHLLLPNQERFPRRHLGRLRKVHQVLAKTRHAQAIFADLGVPTTYLGFTSDDRNDGLIARDWQRCFHLAGGSTLKGTEDLLALWAAHPEWPELVLIQKAENAPPSVPRNVSLISGYIDDDALRLLQNSCGIHLCPSRSEGWGHHLVEALSVGAVVLTTDAPPMNELVSAATGVLVPYAALQPRHLGTNFMIDRGALERALLELFAMSAADKAALGKRARQAYLTIAEGFAQRAAALAHTQ